MIKSKKITGPWSAPVMVESGKGLIDPCPLWDDGKVFLVHAFAGSRAGFKSILVMKELNAAAEKVIGNTVLVYDGHNIDPTVEGPKLYKRNGYYYIFAPAGGVSTGWQLALRSKNIYGPYERKIVMQQGASSVNGPHQGAWIHTTANEDWFIHFQDKAAYGRIVHLQPMQWKNDWPVIGLDKDGDGTGEPVFEYPTLLVAKKSMAVPMQESDEFNEPALGLQWQWQANPQPYWAFCYPSKGVLRLNAVQQSTSVKNLWETPNVLLQKFPAEKFTVISKANFTAKTTGERFGLMVMGLNYAAISMIKKEDGIYLVYNDCINADKGTAESEKIISNFNAGEIYFKLEVAAGGICTFSYSADGVAFTKVERTFTATAGKWIGATVGFFCTRTAVTNDAGFADIDWLRLKK